MADLVNLQQNEYDTSLTQLQELHQTALEKLKALSKDVRTLSQVDGIFYIEKLSEKIEFLMDILETDILTLMETNFAASETSMSDFAEIILNVDTACM